MNVLRLQRLLGAALVLFSLLLAAGIPTVPPVAPATAQALLAGELPPHCRGQNPAAADQAVEAIATLRNPAAGDPGVTGQLLALLEIDGADDCSGVQLISITGGRLLPEASPVAGQAQPAVDIYRVALADAPDGSQAVQVQLRDGAGNTAVLTTSIVLDRRPPQLLAGTLLTPTQPLTSPLVDLSFRGVRGQDSGAGAGFWGIRLATVLTPTLDNADPALVWRAIQLPGAPADFVVPNWSIAADADPRQARGPIEIRAQLIDAAGNPASATLRTSITLAASYADSPEGGQLATVQPAAQPAGLPFFGSNLYLGGLERNDRDDREVLADQAWQGGARWSREEITWAEVQRYRSRYLTFYDTPLRALARRGYGITGMLVTTPEWARNPRCRNSTYYCPPLNVNDFAAFAYWMVERYDGDGYLDARESPRVAAWELWNEPNFQETWPGTPAEYGALMVAGYAAIKAADPTAIVLVGGVYVFDGGNDGLGFLERVFAAVPQAYFSFDVLNIHPYLPTVAPDDPNTLRLVTLEGRIRSSASRAVIWAARYGGAPRPVWVTEVGWCTASQYCTGVEGLSQDRQASYLTRSVGLIKALGMGRLDWFQHEDKFDGESKLKWGDMAIVGTRAQGYAPKQAYFALHTAATQLEGAVFVGYGALHTHRYDATRPYNRDGGGRYHLIFQHPGGARIDLLWQTAGSSTGQLRIDVPAYRANQIDRDGGVTPLAIRNGNATLTISERPAYIRQDASPLLNTPEQLAFLFAPGEAAQQQQLVVRNLGGSSFSWSITGAPAWLQVAPASAAAPGTAILSVDPAQLPAAGASAVLTISAQPEGGTRNVQVRAVVTTSLQRQRLPIMRR